MTWEQTKIILECLTSICFLVGVWKGILFFNYKNDVTIRNLYIEHSKKLREFFTKYFETTRLTEETRRMLFDLAEEAGLYLHKDIVTYIENVSKIAFEIEMINLRLEKKIAQEEREKLCDKWEENSNKIYNLSNQCIRLYRKQILQDAFIPQIASEFNENIVKKLQEIKRKLLNAK